MTFYNLYANVVYIPNEYKNMFSKLRRRRDSEPTASAQPSERVLALRALTLADIEQRAKERADVERLPIGDERLASLIDSIFAAEAPEPGTYMKPPHDLERTVFACSVLPEQLGEGAPVEAWSVPLPVDKFTYAPEFTNWQDGRVDAKNGRPSASVIAKYARMRGDTAAPIQHVVVYMQPDGKVFCGLVGDGAHRLAAAKRRGDSSIRARDVLFARVEKNIV